jgi:hypothetical protein
VGDVETTTWGGCYKDSWKGLIVPEAFSHPAKVARGLAVRLFDHGFERGWWDKGSTVVDPFMGICGFGIIAAYKGLRFVGVEIEERFHSLCLENVALHRRRWEAGGDPVPVCLRGDSRNLAALVAGAAGLVTSPPYADSIDHAPGNKAWVGVRRGNLAQEDYGTTPGQLGALPQGDAEAVITSPPYADSDAHPSLGSVNKDAWGRDGRKISARRGLSDDYGTAPGQVGALKAGDADSVVTSPPYAASVHGRNGIDLAKCDRPGAHTQAGAQGYGDTPGNVGGLAAGGADSVVTSPPFSEPGSQPSSILQAGGRQGVRSACRAAGGDASDDFGATPGQVARERGETYWSACRDIYLECFKVLKPSGVMAVVIKDFVRARKRVPLCDQAWRLLLSLGFTPVEHIRCLLSEETREPSLFGGDEVSRKSRESFFRRLSRKRGAPEIPWEEILVVRRPA